MSPLLGGPTPIVMHLVPSGFPFLILIPLPLPPPLPLDLLLDLFLEGLYGRLGIIALVVRGISRVSLVSLS